MTTSGGTTDDADLRLLKTGLQALTSKEFEVLVAHLMGELIEVNFTLARSGFQFGGDAGTAGRRGRRIRVECKRYKDSTPLSDRELVGELADATARDPELELWILAATREVPEQLETKLETAAVQHGLPVLAVDWPEGASKPLLAALLTADPDALAATSLGMAGVDAARRLETPLAGTLRRLRDSLKVWHIGFESLRQLTQKVLKNVWSNANTSVGLLGQDAAGKGRSVERPALMQQLDDWYAGDPRRAVLLAGLEGVGKTWAAMKWLVDRLDALPVVIVVPSGTASALAGGHNRQAVYDVLARCLWEASGIQSEKYWSVRLRRLLSSPASDGARFVVLFDGLNQEAEAPWRQLFGILQSDPFDSRLRVIATTRPHFLDDRLGGLALLQPPPQRIRVDIYDDTPGGELDAALARAGLTRNDLRPDLLELARVPRLLPLVVSLRNEFADGREITLHRLLWAYGADRTRARRAAGFSEADWHAWLRDIAERKRRGAKTFSTRELSETAARPDLTSAETYDRLSEIVDGGFVQRAGPDWTMDGVLVAHALAVLLIDDLEASLSRATAGQRLADWIDPIAGLDERAEVLRAAVSLALHRGSRSAELLSLLTPVWLQTQNLPVEHRQEISDLASALHESLLDTLEYSGAAGQGTARSVAIDALRNIDLSHGRANAAIIQRAAKWLRVISLHSEVDDADARARWTSRIHDRLGTSDGGTVIALGHALELDHRPRPTPLQAIPELVERFSRCDLIDVFESAAIHLAVAGRLTEWNALRWLCRLNQTDLEGTRNVLIARADSIVALEPELGVDPQLPSRTSALMLWLTSFEEDEQAAHARNPAIYVDNSFYNSYLADPVRGFGTLERRHAPLVFDATDVPTPVQARRLQPWWADPTFIAPEAFIAQMQSLARTYPVDTLAAKRFMTAELHAFEELQPVLARCVPEELAGLWQRWLQVSRDGEAEQRYWTAMRVTEGLAALGNAAADNAQRLRECGVEADAGSERAVENALLSCETLGLSSFEAARRLLQVNVDVLYADTLASVGTLTANESEQLLEEFGHDEGLWVRLIEVVGWCASDVPDPMWEFIDRHRASTDDRLASLAWEALYRLDAARLGTELLASAWTWSPDVPMLAAHFGGAAVIEAPSDHSFQVRMAACPPWLYLRLARHASSPDDVQAAVRAIGQWLELGNVDPVDPSMEIMLPTEHASGHPFVYQARLLLPDNDSIEAISIALDSQKQDVLRTQAIELTRKRFRAAESRGGMLMFVEPALDEVLHAVRNSKSDVERWIEGHVERSSRFRETIERAPKLFVRLCEALLTEAPDEGIALWHAVSSCRQVRVVGDNAVDELINIVFKVPSSVPVEQLRDFLLSPRWARTDKQLFEIAMAAQQGGDSAWLEKAIAADKSSNAPWRQMRGTVLEGFAVDHSLAADGAWPEGQSTTHLDSLRTTAARRRAEEAWARHWWNAFETAERDGEAHAAWVLLESCADRRLMHHLRSPEPGDRIRAAHYEHNHRALRNQMDKQRRDLATQYLGWPLASELDWWRT